MFILKYKICHTLLLQAPLELCVVCFQPFKYASVVLEMLINTLFKIFMDQLQFVLFLCMINISPIKLLQVEYFTHQGRSLDDTTSVTFKFPFELFSFWFTEGCDLPSENIIKITNKKLLSWAEKPISLKYLHVFLNMILKVLQLKVYSIQNGHKNFRWLFCGLWLYFALNFL